MNIKDKIYTEQFLMKLSKEQMDYLVYFFGKKNLSRKVREFLIKAVREEHKNKRLPVIETLSGEIDPVMEYSLNQKGDKVEVTIYENGMDRDPLLYENIDEAMKYVRSIDAKKRK
ncbi:MAG TPA: hypothetical protein PKJ95_06590 [Atribacterota bacterium]|nr:hypothetical protein [Atribacterota bacterium]